MKNIIIFVLLLSRIAFGDIQIGQLPLGTANLTTTNDSFPFVNFSINTTQRLTLWDLPNLPPFQTIFSAISPPLTTKGDLYTRTLTANARFGACPDGQYLLYDSSQPTGLNCGPGGTFTFADLTSGSTGVIITGGTNAVNGSGTVVSVQTANGSQPGLLSVVDWNIFNNKQSALAFGNLTTSTTGLIIGSGTGAVIGSGTTVNVQTASGSQPGLLSAADWTTFNGKQPAGTYVTNVTASAPITSSGGITPNIALTTPLTAANGGTGTSTNTIYNILAGNGTGAVQFIAPGTSGQVVTSNGASAFPTMQSIAISMLPVLSGFSFLTSGTTYTTPVGVNSATNFKFTILGGGGGGGGLNTANKVSAGGGAGASCIVFVTGLASNTGYTMAVGAAGTAGATTPTDGGAGGSSSITINATTYTAAGGAGGSSTPGNNGGVGGSCTNATISIKGQNGGASATGSSTSNTSGNGGASIMGGGGNSVTGNNNGLPGNGFGSGGSGAFGTTVTGGAGTQGCILVEWKI